MDGVKFFTGVGAAAGLSAFWIRIPGTSSFAVHSSMLVSGSIPATGTYRIAPDYGGHPVWTREDMAWSIWWDAIYHIWVISPVIGEDLDEADNYWWQSDGPTGSYNNITEGFPAAEVTELPPEGKNVLSFLEHDHFGLAAIIAGRAAPPKYSPYLYGLGAGLIASEFTQDHPFGIGKSAYEEQGNLAMLILLGSLLVIT
jgi:hypothetical protein